MGNRGKKVPRPKFQTPNSKGCILGTWSLKFGTWGFGLIYLSFIPLYLYSSIPLSAQHTKYWIQFTDKNNNPYSVSTPSDFLSARAIQRRTNQGIAVVENDMPVTPSYYDSVKNVPNITIINSSKWFNAVTIYTTDTNALNTIINFSFVADTQPVQKPPHPPRGDLRRRIPCVSPFGGIKGGLWVDGLDYGTSFNQIDMIGGLCLHNQGFQGEGMVIAVMDAGFYRVDSLPVFDSLRANGQILGTWDFVDNDTMVYDSHTHGTMVLSTMGGNMPGMIIGTAPKAKYWLFRTEQGTTEYVIEEDNWVSAAEFADSAGADVFTTSLGYTTFDDSTQNHTYADMDGNTTRISIATDIAASKGILPVCSAGNSGGSAWNYIGAPADADSVLAVGAVDAFRNYALFSSKGPSYDGRVKPNVAAQGQDVAVADPGAGGVSYGSGTSFSGPIIAGMAACLWQAHPESTNMQVFNAIQQTASRFFNPDTLIGYGIADFCAANIALGAEEFQVSDSMFHVYPNPFAETATLRITNPLITNFELTMFDVFGMEVYSVVIRNSNQFVIRNGELASGVYMLNVKSGNRIYSAKLVKY